MDALVTLYNLHYPDVNVLLFFDKNELLTRLQSGNPPDTFQAHCGQEVVSVWLKPGYVEPITQLWKSQGWRQKMPPDLVTMLTYKGNLYCVPLNIHRGNVLWYNKSLFAAAGIKKAPASWKEFFADCDKLKKAGIAPIAQGGLYGFELPHTFEDILLSTLGASDYKGLWTGKTSWNSAKVTQALNTFKKFLSYANPDYNTVGYDAAIQRVIDGSAATNIMGDWANGMFLAAGKVPGVDYGWALSWKRQ